MIVRGGIGAAGVAVLLLCALPCSADGTRRWVEEPERLRLGEAHGIAVTSLGRLFPGPEPDPLGDWEQTERDAYVWSMAADRTGNLFLGTGPDGRILRIGTGGKVRVFYTVEQPMVTALAVLADGGVLAGTAPEGKIYRIDADGRGSLWSETGANYVWSLAAATDGTIYAATGDGGVIYTIAPDGTASSFFDSDESHIISLLPRPDGSLIAGGAGRGLIYRIDSGGNARVLHDDALPEVRALAMLGDGSLVAALVAPPTPERRAPALRIELPDGSSVAGNELGELDDDSRSTIQGYIEGLRLPETEPAGTRRGRVVRIDGGAVTELWASNHEAPYCLALDSSGRAVFGTGEPGRLYRVEGPDEIALVASLAEAQITGLLRVGPTLAVATSNPAAAYRLDRPAVPARFRARAFDAGVVSRWGRLDWELSASAGRAEFFTRSGNSAAPDESWSAWSPALTASPAEISSPDARFLQWRVSLIGGREVQVSRIGFSYAPHNRTPLVRDFRLQGDPRAVSGEAVVRWSVSDPDGDPIEVRVDYRLVGRQDWSEALTRSPAFESGENAGWRSDEGRWNVSDVEEGAYELRAIASDRPGNPPGEAHRSTTPIPLRVWVDRTPPRIVAEATGDGLRVEVTDGESTVARLELIGTDGTRFRLRPLDGVCDSARESFELDGDPWGAEFTPRVLRAVDAAGNANEQPWPVS